MKKSFTLLAGISKQVRAAKNLIKLSDLQKEVLVGVTLGDVTIRLEGKLKFEQQYNKKEYINHLYEIFKEFCNVSPQVRKIVGGGASDRFSIWFQTYQHNEFKIFRELFYKQKVDANGNLVFKNDKPVYIKGISDTMFLAKWLTPRAIAYWYMDDGTCNRDKNKNIITIIKISTHGFNKNENAILSNFLNVTYGFKSRVAMDGEHFYLYFSRENVANFIALIKPFVHNDFLYKIQ